MMNGKKGFTFVEVLIVTAITAVLASAVIIVVNPAKRFEQARDMQREIHLQSILSAIEMRETVEKGWPAPCEDLPQEMDENENPLFKTIGTKDDPNFYDLYKCLVPTYLSSELFDPAEGSAEDTKYQIWQNPYSKNVTLIYVKGEKELSAGPEEYGILYIPTVDTADEINTTCDSAESGGNVTSDGGSAVFERGIVWATSSGATILNNRTVDGSGTGAFISNATNLEGGVTYFIRAYARNDVGVGYGEEKEFLLQAMKPTAKTLAAIDVNSDTATIRGEITCIGVANPTRYFEWGKTGAYEYEDISLGVGGFGVFSFDLTDLDFEQIYYYRACANNSAGISCGDQKSFVTYNSQIVVTTNDLSNINYSSADSGGSVVSDDRNPPITARGVCWNTSGTPVYGVDHCTFDGTGAGSFVSHMTGLSPGTDYHVRAYAYNSNGPAYGDERTFTTLLGLCQGKGSGSDPGGTALSCSARASCLSGETVVLKISDTDNAHAELPSQTFYDHYICCSGNNLGNTCQGKYDAFLKLSEQTNAHVEKDAEGNYTNSACLSTTYGTETPYSSTIKCNYASDCSSLGSLYTCLASISGDTNAHIGECSSSIYSTKVCCANVCP
ncbi:MAG: type II secretion system protein [Candidatus Paceibacterota bacterium]